MKKTLPFLLLLIGCVSLISCKKDNDKPQEPATVSIEGKEYPVVKIGDQTWMATNYSGSNGVYCDNDASLANYGKLYSKEEAKAVIPPSGWRLPSHQDYINLFESQGVEFNKGDENGFSYMSDMLRKFMSTSNWIGNQGTNITGFNAYPTGFYEDDNYTHKGAAFSLWTSTELADQRYYFGIFNTGAQPYAYYGPIGADQKFSIRFVKNN